MGYWTSLIYTHVFPAYDRLKLLFSRPFYGLQKMLRGVAA